MTSPYPGSSLMSGEQSGGAIEDWAFNVRLECLGRDDDPLEVAIGGAILNLRDLDRILDVALARSENGA